MTRRCTTPRLQNACTVLVLLAVLSASAGATELVSLSSDQAQGDAFSVMPSVSDDGRRIVFTSFASNLVDGDSNDNFDIFLRDRDMRTTTRISVDSDGGQAQGASVYGRLSGDGRTAVFASSAVNLASRDFNNVNDVFAKQVAGGETLLVSVSVSGDAANGESSLPAVSRDGGRVAFVSSATNLIGTDRNNASDIFLRDLTDGTTILVSQPQGGGAADADSTHPAISPDGSFVVFATDAGNLAAGDRPGYRDIVLADLLSGARTTLSAGIGPGNCDEPSVSEGARRVSFICDRIFFADGRPYRRKAVFLHEGSGARLISVDARKPDASANMAQATLSGDGSTLVFLLTDRRYRSISNVIRYDLETGGAILVSGDSCADTGGDRHSYQPSISADGRWVAFRSNAANLVSSDQNLTDDVFIRDATTLDPSCTLHAAQATR